MSEISDVAAARPLFRQAAGLYVEFFGKPRGAYGSELGTLARGVAKKRKADRGQTEASLRKKQRAALDRLAAESDRPSRSKTMFGASMPGPADVASVWTERHEDLKQAFAEKREHKIAEARETRRQGLRGSTTAPLKTFTKKCATAREQRLHDEMAKHAARGPARRFDKATCYIGAKGISEMPGQRRTDDLHKADIIVTGKKLEKPDWRAAHAMLVGKIVAEDTDLTKSRHVAWRPRPETVVKQHFGSSGTSLYFY